MTKKVFTDESLATFVDEVKSYTDSAVSTKANSSHNHAASNITSGTLSSDRLPTVPITKGGTGATTAAAALTNLGLTATASELNKLDGVTATTTELNYVDGVTSNIQTQLDDKANKQNGIYYVVGNSTTAGTWTGTSNDITQYYDGLTVAYKLNVEGGSSTTTLNINGLGAKTVYLRGTTKVTTHYPVDTVIIAVYTTVSGTGRWYVNDYDANSYAYVRQYKTSTDAEYPMLFAYETSLPSSYDTKYVRKNAAITANPSTGTITATTFQGDLSGNATSATSATSATKATQDASGNTITSTYETKIDASAKLDEAKEYTDTVANGKANSSHTHSISNVTNLQTTLDGKVPTSRTINGKALSDDITLSASDVGAAASSHSHSSYVNQNAFSNVKVGSTTVSADTTTDTLEIASGTGISVSGDATNDKVTITNSGVRSISTGSSNGTISVNTNGTSADVAVKGLGSAAYKATTAFDASGTAQTKADAALASAKSYTDEKISLLVNNASTETLDSISELATAIEENDSAIDALNTIAAGKASASDLTSHTSNKSNPHGVTLAQLGVTATAAELNKMDGVTATTAELNILDGVTATTAELNYVDGVTSNIQTQLDGKAASSHTHKYAGSSSAGGAATSANKINTDAGSATQPVYFANGIPVATTYTLGKSVPSDAKFTDTTYSNATTSAAGLMSVNDKTKLDYTNIAYGTCSTAAATAAKVITVSGNTNWSLTAGATIVVKFSNTNTASNPTFNVNGTGAKSVWYGTSVLTTSSLSYAGYKNRPMIFVYDGTQYVFMGWSYDANTTYSNASLGQGYGTCSTAAATAAKVVTLSSYALTTGGVVAVKFTYAVPASATMNINSKGAKSIYYRGAAITADVIKAGDVATFIYNGSQYHLISIDRWQNDIDSLQTAVDGKAASSHTHTKSQITDFPTSLKNPNALTIQGNGTTLTNGTYDGSAAKTVNITPSAIGAAASSHTHDDRYYTETEIDTKLSGKANSSHGNHVPTTQTASNKVFLRNDNTWATVTPANIGAAASSHTHTVANITDLTATAAELNYMDGVTSNVQTQLDAKQATITGGATTITGSNLTANRALISNGSGKVAVSAVTSTELGYLDGVTSAIQTQLNGKASTAVATTSANGLMSAADKTKLDLFTYDFDTPQLYIDGGAAQIDMNDDCVDILAPGGLYHNGYEVALKSDIPQYITTGAQSGSTIGNYATAEGYGTTASGLYSHAEGYNTTASALASHAEGSGTTASGLYSHAAGIGTIANNYQYVVGKYNADTTAPATMNDTTTPTGLFIVGIGTSSARSNGFRVSAGGKVYGTGTFGTSGADYAEYFEWFDGNPNNEDRRGRFVTLEGDKIRYATPNDDYILGVVSADPSVAGDIYSESWHDMYLKDVFGSKIVEVVEVEETTNEDGEIIPAHTERRWVLNPDYDPNAEYTSREERPEWAAIGIVGKLVVVDDGTCQVNGYCYPNANGIATISQDKTNYRVMERLDDTHIRIFIR